MASENCAFKQHHSVSQSDIGGGGGCAAVGGGGRTVDAAAAAAGGRRWADGGVNLNAR
jgi:hypothetical protein